MGLAVLLGVLLALLAIAWRPRHLGHGRHPVLQALLLLLLPLLLLPVLLLLLLVVVVPLGGALALQLVLLLQPPADMSGTPA